MRTGLVAGVRAGIIAGLIGLVLVSVVVFIAGHSQFSTVVGKSGICGRLVVVASAEATVATLCGIAVGVAIVGALAVMPVVWWRDRRSVAPAA